MLRLVKNITIGVLIVLLMAGTVAAQDDGISAGQKIDNIGDFLATFFDIDNSLAYMADTFIQNQCKKRDVFTLHDQKDSIGDYMLANFRTLSQPDIELQKRQYTLYTAELIFVRNLMNLDNEELSAKVLSSDRIGGYENDVRGELEGWFEKYKREDYMTCDNSWSIVVQKVENIKETAGEIKTNAEALKEQFLRTGQEMLDTPGNFAENASENIIGGLEDSFNETWGNLQDEANRLSQELAGEDIDRRHGYEIAAESQLANVRNRQSLAQVLESERSLREIPQILREQEDSYQIDRQQAIQDTVIQAQVTFTDDATFILWNDVLQLNARIERANQIAGNDNDGVAVTAGKIEDNQCNR